MGKIQCVSTKPDSDIWDVIEKGVDKQLTLHQKIFCEYQTLRSQVKGKKVI
jgi:hypothetical protein